MSNLLHLLPLALDAGHPREAENRALPRDTTTPVAEPLPAPLPKARAKSPAISTANKARGLLFAYLLGIAFVFGQAAWTTQAGSCPVPQETH